MKTLILNIDRDDDFGRKAKVKSPIIGLKKNVEAANKLGEIDPEDSDLNAIFYAISTYKKLKNEGKDVEVATLCGNISVGLKSDEIISAQLEEVIELTKADDVILISDGAEDEYILPIVQSRIKITSVNRVSVKQSRELEDAYYRILKILDDEKVQKQFILPIALVFLAWAFLSIIGLAESGFGFILLILGIYLLIRVFRWEKNVAIFFDEMRQGVTTGRISIYMYILSLFILIAFGLYAYSNTDFNIESQAPPIFEFIYLVIWGVVVAGIMVVFGRAVDSYVKEKIVPLFAYVAPFSLIAFGFLVYAVFFALHQALQQGPENFQWSAFTGITFIFYIVSGSLIAILGVIIHNFVRDMRSTKEKEYEVDKQTKNVVENS
jgi:putative membrane protein